MQLSAYAQGCGFDNPERVSIFVDRADTELITCHIWDKETHVKHRDMFNSILKYWQLVKNYEWKTSKTN
jgi:pyridoxine 5'-phosphate synthase PdxJ